MKHGLLMSAAAAVALCGAAVPGVAGIVGNTSFSDEIPVRVPAGAQVALLRTGASTSSSRAPAPAGPVTRRPVSSGPGSSPSAARTPAPAPSSSRSTQPAPDRNEATHHASASEPGDDRGRTGPPPAPRTPGRGSGGGNDDAGGHGGNTSSAGSSSSSNSGGGHGGGGRHGGDG